MVHKVWPKSVCNLVYFLFSSQGSWLQVFLTRVEKTQPLTFHASVITKVQIHISTCTINCWQVINSIPQVVSLRKHSDCEVLGQVLSVTGTLRLRVRKVRMKLMSTKTNFLIAKLSRHVPLMISWETTGCWH